MLVLLQTDTVNADRHARIRSTKLGWPVPDFSESGSQPLLLSLFQSLNLKALNMLDNPGIWAKPILRSRNASRPDRVLSTLLVRMPRCVLAEWNTHRQFSRNAASTRAIPTQRLIDQAINDPFIPMVWGLNQAGMQAGGEHNAPNICEYDWLKGRDYAVDTATRLMNLGLHKQIVGRVLEPWLWTIVCVSSTEWTNFLALRDHHMAEPHIALLASKMRVCLEDDASVQLLQPGEWHLPFVDKTEWAGGGNPRSMGELIALSVARSASTSYRTTDGFDMTLERATALYEKLFSIPFHASPFEHQAVTDECRDGRWLNPNDHRNFIGFRQNRALVEAERL